jgi:hypothetical protein
LTLWRGAVHRLLTICRLQSSSGSRQTSGLKWDRASDSLDLTVSMHRVLQETKLSRQDLSGDVIMAEGYEAFVSCNRSSKGRGAYSGKLFWNHDC